MRVTTSFRRGPFAINLGFALFCLVGAIWGAYDYWIHYPHIEESGRQREEALRVKQHLEEISGVAPSSQPGGATVAGRPLTDEETRQYEEAKATIKRIEDEFGGAPRKLAAYDRPLQLWLWVIGCGLFGLPFFTWPLIKMLRRRWTLEEDGSLRTPWRVIPLDQVETIDMSRWCSPTGSKRSTWKAWLVLKDGTREELDDHDYLDMHRIIGFYAHHFHPHEWTIEAKRVKPDGSAGDEAPPGADSRLEAESGARSKTEAVTTSSADDGGGHGSAGDGGGGNGGGGD